MFNFIKHLHVCHPLNFMKPVGQLSKTFMCDFGDTDSK